MVGQDLLFFDELAGKQISAAGNMDKLPCKDLRGDTSGHLVPKRDMQMMMAGAAFVSAFVAEYLGGAAQLPDGDLTEWTMAGCAMMHEWLADDGETDRF